MFCPVSYIMASCTFFKNFLSVFCITCKSTKEYKRYRMDKKERTTLFIEFIWGVLRWGLVGFLLIFCSCFVLPPRAAQTTSTHSPPSVALCSMFSGPCAFVNMTNGARNCLSKVRFCHQIRLPSSLHSTTR